MPSLGIFYFMVICLIAQKMGHEEKVEINIPQRFSPNNLRLFHMIEKVSCNVSFRLTVYRYSFIFQLEEEKKLAFSRISSEFPKLKQLLALFT